MRTIQLTAALTLCFAALAHGQTMTSQSAGNQNRRSFAPKAWVWPLPGVDGQDWVINNYVDLDPGPGILDYMGGNKSYNGHRGIDIDVPTFRAMDADFPIRSVDDGVVIALDDAHFDRNTSCSGQWNFVTVQHDDGHTAIYGHLKQHSVIVTIGQAVNKGQQLGVVGSSGCSTAPHLHLETTDTATGDLVDPFTEGLFGTPPIYDTAFSLMDVVVDDVALTSIPDILDPDPNISSLGFGQTIGVGLSMAGGGVGDQIRFAFYKPDGSFYDQHVVNLGQTYRHHFWLCNMVLAQVAGDWRVDIELNGSVEDSYDFTYGPSLGAAREARFRILASDYQAEFNYFLANNYRPVWLDGYVFNGQTYFNVIFEQGSPFAWQANHHLSGAGFDNLMVSIQNAGWRPTHVESYMLGSEIRYAVITDSSPGSPWTVYRAADGATHQANFNTLVGQGYRPAEVSALYPNGNYSITALYDQDNVGGWFTQTGVPIGDYQSHFDTQTAAGRFPKYFNVFETGGNAYVSYIFDSVPPNGWVARHNMSPGFLSSEHSNWTGQGLDLQFVSGYTNGGAEQFGAVWSN